MELRDFISKSLIEITEGLKTANEKNDQKEVANRKYCFYIDRQNHNKAYVASNYIEFDLLVGFEKGEGAKAGLVAVFGGVGAEVDSTHSTSNRIKFKIKVD